jgi:hypothetical protein
MLEAWYGTKADEGDIAPSDMGEGVDEYFCLA